LHSLYQAMDKLQENTVISYGDIIFKSYILNELLNDDEEITIMVDADWERSESFTDYVKADSPYSKTVFQENVSLVKMSHSLYNDEICGEFIGLWKVSGSGSNKVKKALERLAGEPDFKRKRMSDLFNELIKETSVAVKYIKGSWMDVDDAIDLQKAGEL